MEGRCIYLIPSEFQTFPAGGWVWKMKLMLNSAVNKVVVEVEAELGNKMK